MKLFLLRVVKKAYKECSILRKIISFFMKNKIVGKVQYSTLLSHCKFDVDKNNSVVIEPSDYLIKNLIIKVKGENNKLIIKENLMTYSDLEINITGSNNLVEIGECGRFRYNKSEILVNGNNSSVVIQQCCKFKGLNLNCREDNTKVLIGEAFDSNYNLLIYAMEGKNIKIGNDVLISSNVSIRNNDGHSILNAQGERINTSKDITIGNHVWITQDVLILKGSEIPDNCIIGARSIVNKKFETRNTLILGSPAVVKKENVNWDARRL